MKRSTLLVTTMAMLLAVAGCGPGDPDRAGSASTDEAPAAGAGSSSAAPETPSGSSELAGTSWRLVKIMSMDDSVYEPDDRTLYTLEFGKGDGASLLADCNRGTGTWTSESPGQLVFGPIAATSAACLPGSLSERYLAQFQWVRSYVLEDGHLFLATMADGSIIEFEPAD